ncbi:uncharacterized protein DMAD_13232 [Drosophila madeirensis]|uniref:Serine/arginine repetitive matrix protein 2 n=1 Tax=Drosophila madeirensis TaxID=30013 RepID=A0AAU9FJW3_DROMD
MNEYIKKRRTAKQILLRRALSKCARHDNDTETTTPLCPLSKTGITVLSSLSRDPKLVRAMQRTLSRSSRERPKSQTRPKVLKNSPEFPLLKKDTRSWRRLKTSDGLHSRHLLEGKSGASLGGAASRGSSRSRSSAYPSSWALDVRVQEEKAQETSNSLQEVTNCARLNRTPYDHQLNTPLKSDHSVQCTMKAAARRQRRTKAQVKLQPQPKPLPKPQQRAVSAQTQTLPKQMPKVELPKLPKYKPPKKCYKSMFTSVLEEKLLGRSRSPSKTSENSFSIRKIRQRASSGEDVKRSHESAKAKIKPAPMKRDYTDYGGYTPSDVSLEQVPFKKMSNMDMPRGTGGHRHDSRWTMLLPTEKDIEKYIHEAAYEDCASCSARERMPNRYDESYGLDSAASGHCICERGANERQTQSQSLSRSGSHASTTDDSSRMNLSTSRKPRTRQASQSSTSYEPRSSHRRTRGIPSRESVDSLNRDTRWSQGKSRAHRESSYASSDTNKSRNKALSTDASASSIVNRRTHASTPKSQRNSQPTSRRPSDYGRAKSKGYLGRSASRKHSRHRDKGNSERRSSHRARPRREGSVEVIPVEIGAENLRKRTSQMISKKNSVGSFRRGVCNDSKCRRKCHRCADASTLTSGLNSAAGTGLHSQNSRKGGSFNMDSAYRGATNSCGICPVTKTCDPICVEASGLQSHNSRRSGSQNNPGSFNAGSPFRGANDPKSVEASAQTSQTMMMVRQSRSRVSMDFPNNDLLAAQRSQVQPNETGGRSLILPPCCCHRANCQFKCSEACTQTNCPWSGKKAKKDHPGSDECDVSRIIQILQTALAGLELEQRARQRDSTSRVVDEDQLPNREGTRSSHSNSNEANNNESDGTYRVPNMGRQFDPYQHNMCYCPNHMCAGASNVMGQSIPFLNVGSLRPDTKRILQYISQIGSKKDAAMTPMPPDEERKKPEKLSGGGGYGQESKQLKGSEKFVHVLSQSKDEEEAPYSSTSKSSYPRYNDEDRSGPEDAPNRRSRKHFSLKSYLGAKQRCIQPHLMNKFRKTRGRSKVREAIGSYCPVLGIKSKKRSNIYLMRPTSCYKYVPIRHEPDSNYKKCLLSKGRTEKNSPSEDELRGRTCCQTENCISEGEQRGRTRFATENTLSEGELRGGTRFPAAITRARDSGLKKRPRETYNRNTYPQPKKQRRNTEQTFVKQSFLNNYEAQIFKDFEKYRETRAAEAAASSNEKCQEDPISAADATKSICQQEPICSYLQYHEQRKPAVTSKICLQDPICQHCKLMKKSEKKVSMQSVKENEQPGPRKSLSKESKISEKNQQDQHRGKKPSQSKGIFSWCLKKSKDPSAKNLKKDDKQQTKSEKKNTKEKEGTATKGHNYTKITKSKAHIHKFHFNLQPLPAKKVIVPEAKTYAQTTSVIIKPAINFCDNERTHNDARNEVRVLYDSSARFAKETCSVRVLPDPSIPARPRFRDYSTSSCSIAVPYQCHGEQQQQQQEQKMDQKIASTNAFYSIFQQQNPHIQMRNCDCEFQRKWDIF